MSRKAPAFLLRFARLLSSSSTAADARSIDDLAKLINNQPIAALRHRIPPRFLASPLLDSLLLRLFAAHSASDKALHIFRLSLRRTTDPTPSAFAAALHIATRARHFDAAFELTEDVARSHPTLLTPKSLAVLLSRIAKFQSFDRTLDAFERVERAWVSAGLSFGVDEFNALLRAYCARGRISEARAIFRMLHQRFSPNLRTLNTILLGFKETRNLVALDTFYHQMIIRGFEPDAVTYCIRMDAYCKKLQFLEALDLLDEMVKKNCSPTVETITTLIHGAGLAKDPHHARKLFDEMGERGLTPDRAAYNALVGAFVRAGDLKSALVIMDEMEEKAIGLDDFSYYTVFCGMKKHEDLEGFWNIYKRMVDKNYVPRVRTVMLLMKVFCQNGKADSGLELWDYLLKKGCCPHTHAFDLLITGLCCRGKVTEAYRCFKQVVDRGRAPSERTLRVLEDFLVQAKQTDMVQKLGKMAKRLQMPFSSSH